MYECGNIGIPECKSARVQECKSARMSKNCAAEIKGLVDKRFSK